LSGPLVVIPSDREGSAFSGETRKKQIPRAKPALRNDSCTFMGNVKLAGLNFLADAGLNLTD
jgi:hypothetical protein